MFPAYSHVDSRLIPIIYVRGRPLGPDRDRDDIHLEGEASRFRWLQAPDLNQQYYGFPAIAHVECFSRVVIEQGLALRSMRNCWRKRDRDERRARIPFTTRASCSQPSSYERSAARSRDRTGVRSEPRRAGLPGPRDRPERESPVSQRHKLAGDSLFSRIDDNLRPGASWYPYRAKRDTRRPLARSRARVSRVFSEMTRR